MKRQDHKARLRYRAAVQEVLFAVRERMPGLHVEIARRPKARVDGEMTTLYLRVGTGLIVPIRHHRDSYCGCAGYLVSDLTTLVQRDRKLLQEQIAQAESTLADLRARAAKVGALLGYLARLERGRR